MPRKYLRKFLPSTHSMREHRYLRPFGPVLHHPNLWHLNRHSVAGGVAVGLFTGLIPGPVQMLFAAIFAVVFRVNLPVAVFTTLYTNPLTFVPLYLLAYEIGAFVTGRSNGMHNPYAEFQAESLADWIPAFFNWISSLGMPLLVGVPILGAIFSVCGYFLVRGLWRLHVVISWRRRQRKRST
ncbi:MAG: DUF2062 domain-containing protein [Sulfuricella sp.]|nr:DUF2062 domain-containing protein [Sulfuricella sp.]